ncbi:MAG: DUF2306 domain-containing protein [Woeseiaceae bacterium]
MEHSLQHPLGLIHVLLAVLAIAFGALVIFSRKGTRKHKWFGRCYVGSMVAVNGSALMIYELFGSFGLFHWMALLSLLSVLAGYIPARIRKPGWRAQHAYFMSGSYAGLIAALAAEILTRTPWLPFFGSVAVATCLVVVVGIMLMFRFIPRLL